MAGAENGKADTPKAESALFFNEEHVLAETQVMLGKLESVSAGVQRLVEAYRESYKVQRRLVRLSDRMQFDLQQANQNLAAQAEELIRLNRALADEIAERKRLKEEIHRLSMLDSLTGLLVRHEFVALAQKALLRAQAYALPLGLLVIDFDGYHPISREVGPVAADEALARFAQLCAAELRVSDLAGRMGGSTLAALLTETDLEGTQVVAGRIRSKLQDSLFSWGETTRPFSVAVGAAALMPDHAGLDDLLAICERALHQERERNQGDSAAETR